MNAELRCILCLDIDCFFAQVLLKDRPDLKDKPVGIRQKYIIVTCTYEARKLGIKKLMLIKDALELVPELIILDGSDITPFRAAGRQLFQVARATLGNIPIERKGFDEIYADITEPCLVLMQDKKNEGSICEYFGEVFPRKIFSENTEIFQAGSEIAIELRSEISMRLGFKSCAGISSSKFAAKLASNFTKPNNQTVFLPHFPEYVEYFQSLPVSYLPGLGRSTFRLLKVQGLNNTIKTCGDLTSALPKERLAQVLNGDLDFASQLLELAIGIDHRKVENMDMFTSQLSREETKLPHPTNAVDLKLRVQELIGPLFDLIQERIDKTLEIPKSLKLSIKFRGELNRRSKSRRFVEFLLDEDYLSRMSSELLNEFNLPPSFVATHVNLGVSDFGEDPFVLDKGEPERAPNSLDKYFTPSEDRKKMKT